MVVCCAPTYPPETGPTQKNLLPFWVSFFFSYSVNKLFFKIIKSCILIEERLQRLLSYALLYTL